MTPGVDAMFQTVPIGAISCVATDAAADSTVLASLRERNLSVFVSGGIDSD
jgi:hypothetical protein